MVNFICQLLLNKTVTGKKSPEKEIPSPQMAFPGEFYQTCKKKLKQGDARGRAMGIYVYV